MSNKKPENKVGIGQKINCNVCECAYNCIEDSTCRLDSIKVCNCSSKKTKDPLKDTACGSYEYVGDLNIEEMTGN